MWITVEGALAIGASRCASLARTLASIVLTRRRHDVVENPDLILGIAVGAVDEEIGYAGKNVDPAVDIAGGEGGLEFVKEGKGTHHNSGRRHAVELSITMH